MRFDNTSLGGKAITGRAGEKLRLSGTTETGKRVTTTGRGRVAYVRGGKHALRAALSAATALGLCWNVVQKHPTEGWAALEVVGDDHLLGRFLDSTHVLHYHEPFSGPRPPRPVQEPGRTETRRPAFESDPVRPAPAPPREVLAKRDAPRKALVKEMTRNDKAAARRVDPETTFGSFRKGAPVDRPADRFFLYVNGRPFLGGATVEDVVRKIGAARLPEGATLTLLAPDGEHHPL